LIILTNQLRIKKKLDISKGSLHCHFRYLEKNNLVSYRKEFRGITATTIYSITEKDLKNLLN